MGTFRVKIPHVRQRNGFYFFEATPAMREQGIFSEALGPDRAKAFARAEFLNAQWRAERTGGTAPKAAKGTIAWLIVEYERSTWYAGLAPRTQESAQRHLKHIKSAIGKSAVTDISRKHCRTIHEKMAKASSPANANETIKWLRRLFSYAIEIEERTDNPAAGMGLKSGKVTRPRWTLEEVESFCATALEIGKRPWALSVAIGYDTSQRLADVLSITWHQWDGEGLSFEQSKTDAAVWVPVRPATKQLIDDTPKVAIQMIVGERGHAITQRAYYRREFEKIKAAAGIRPELWFKDLRGTAATEILSGGGRSEPVTGHRPGSVVIRRYEQPSKDAARASQKARWDTEQ